MATLIVNTENGITYAVADSMVDDLLLVGKPKTQHEKSNIAQHRFRMATPEEVQAFVDAGRGVIPHTAFDTDDRAIDDEKKNPPKRPRFLLPNIRQTANPAPVQESGPLALVVAEQSPSRIDTLEQLVREQSAQLAAQSEQIARLLSLVPVPPPPKPAADLKSEPPTVAPPTPHVEAKEPKGRQ